LTAENKNALNSLWVPIFIFLLGTTYYIFQQQQKSTPYDQLATLESFLQSEYDYAAKYLNQPQVDLYSYDAQIAEVFVFDNGDLAFWTESEINVENNHRGILTDTIQDNILILPIFTGENATLSQKILDITKITGDFQLSEHADSSYNLVINDQNYNIIYLPERNQQVYNPLLIILIILAYIWALILLYNQSSNTKNLLISIGLGFFLRFILYGISSYYGESFIFNHSNSLSYFNSSVGDFLLNIFLIGFLGLCFRKWALRYTANLAHHKLLAVANGFFISLSFIYLCYISKGFILDSDINVDIDSVLLFDISSVILVLCLIFCNIFICFYSIFTLHLLKQEDQKYRPLLFHLLGVVLSGFTFFFFLSFHPLLLGAFIMAYIIMMDLFVESQNKGVVWLIWWMVIHGLFTTSIVYYYGIQKDNSIRQNTLEERLTGVKDQVAYEFERLRDNYFSSDIRSTLSMLPQQAKLDIKDFNSFVYKSLEDQIPQGFSFTETHLIDQNNESILRDDLSGPASFSNQLKITYKITDKLFYNFYNSSWIISDTIDAIDNSTGPFRLVLIFKNMYKKPPDNENVIFIKDQTIVYPNILPFNERAILESSQKNQTFTNGGYTFSSFGIDNSFRLVSFRPLGGLIKPMSLFSYLFTLSGILLILIGLINSKFPFLPIPFSIKFNQKTSLRNRIQMGVIIILIFSFIIIGLLTAVYFKNILEDNRQQNENNDLITLIEKVKAEAQLAFDEESAINRIKTKIDQLSGLFPHQLKLYDHQARLIFSSDNAELISEKRIPWEYFNSMKENLTIENVPIHEQNSATTTYIPLFYDNEQPFAYYAIQHVTFGNNIQSIYDFLSTLLNVYVFLFLLAGAVAIIISNSITMPLSTLALKLRDFKLGQRNEPLKWDQNDEIGTLIKDYNNLIIQVEESADVIAKTERDTAWREMAKQVAHEIKNPLTPMKLSLQYLQRAIKTEGVDPRPLIERVTLTLIEQIDNLTNIANEFSNFAKMPKSNNEKVILNELVEAVHDLFRKREDMDILLSEPINDLYVFADRNQLVRILNNLVKNAIQAIPTDRRGIVEISLSQKGNNAIVKVKDNGVGIPDEMKKKVFTPNFTTKSSGTGLGLAISANIIEGFNGKIYFDTVLGEGTNFYVEIPLMRLEENVEGLKRVTLDDED
jgi:signal transduction histidine kinase